MGSPLTAQSPEGTLESVSWGRIVNATSIEQQAAIILTHLQRKETEFNRANPAETPKDRTNIATDYDTGTFSASVDLLMTPNAVQLAIVDAIQAHLPVGTTPEAGPVVV